MTPFNPLATAGKVISCKAAVARGPRQPLVVEQILVAPPQATEVRLKIIFTSICHTDLTFWAGENQAFAVFPRILGHEAVGVVESVGEEVTDVGEGDYVISIFNGECRACEYCRRPETNLCKDYRVDPSRSLMRSDNKTRFSTVDGEPIFHFLNTSTFTEFTVLDAACVVKIDPHYTMKKMSLLSCGFTTGIGAAWNVANVEAGKTVAVFGLGGVGLAVVEGAKQRKAARIIGVDVNPEKFEKGKKMGVTDFVNPNDGAKLVHERVREMTGGGVDYSFECTGNVAVIREAFRSTHDGWGKTVLVGVYNQREMVPLHPMELYDGRTVTGTCFGGFKGKTQLPELAKNCIDKGINLDEFITHELPFEEIAEGMKLLEEGKALRCLLHF